MAGLLSNDDLSDGPIRKIEGGKPFTVKIVHPPNGVFVAENVSVVFPVESSWKTPEGNAAVRTSDFMRTKIILTGTLCWDGEDATGVPWSIVFVPERRHKDEESFVKPA